MARVRRNVDIRTKTRRSPPPLPPLVSHVLCMTTGLTGVLHASFEVVSRLEDAGFRVSYACPHDVRERVEAQGIEYYQLPPVDFSPAPALPPITGPARHLRKVWTAVRTLDQRRHAALQRMGLAEFEALLAELRPDLILIDMELHDHIMCAVAREYPVVLMCQFASAWRRPGLPPIDSEIIPGRGRSGGRMGIWLAWSRRRIRRWMQARLEAARAFFVDRRSILRFYARESGFPVRLLEETNWPPPFTYAELPVVSLVAEEFDFPHPHRPRFHYVGPIAALDRVQTEGERERAAACEELVRRCEEAGQTLIVCTVTTMEGENEDLGFLRRLIEAVRDRPEWMVVLGVGAEGAVERLGPLPPNVAAFPWIPQARLLRSADLSIQHGGIHTVNECILHGVPILMYCGARHDQAGNAARVEWAGLGHSGDRAGDDSAAIARRIEAVLADGQVRERVAAFSRRARSEQARERLATVVGRYIDDPRAPHDPSA